MRYNTYDNFMLHNLISDGELEKMKQMKQTEETKQMKQTEEIKLMKQTEQTKQRKQIAVLGTGTWALALTDVLLKNGHGVKMWGRSEAQIKELQEKRMNSRYLPDYKLEGEIEFSTDLRKCVQDVEFILNVIPTQSIRSVIENMGEIAKDVILINASKGIEKGSLKRISEIFAQYYPAHRYVVFSGPSHAEEVIKKMPTAILSASSHEEAARAVQDLFMNEYMRVYTGDDVIGVEISGALKNIIAIAAGVCDGIGYGDNSVAAIVTRGIVEIKRLGIMMGAKPQTFDGISGIGDLIVTCTSKHSRNRRYGKLIGEGKDSEGAIAEINMAVEGISTAIAANELALIHHVEMPIQTALYHLITGESTAKQVVENLMLREKKSEY